MSYKPNPVPFDAKDLPRFLQQELLRLSNSLADSAEVIFYRPSPTRCSLSAGIAANWKVAGNVLLISASATITLTGLARDSMAGNREVVLINTGTAAVVLLSEDATSSASNRIVLPATWNLSANAAAILWRDPYAARWRGIAKT